MTETATRIRWNDTERSAVVEAMARLLAASPDLSRLEAVRRAQAEVLPVDRQRDLKTWAAVQPVLEERLVAALAQASAAGGTEASASAQQLEPLAQAESHAAPAGEVAGPPASPAAEPEQAAMLPAPQTPGQAPAVGQLEPVAERLLRPAVAGETAPGDQLTAASVKWADALEAAMLAALQSPAVEEALLAVFQRALSRVSAAPDSRTSGAAAPLADERPARVLLAGFSPPAAKSIEETLRQSFDVRSWKPAQGPQLLETLARMCSVAVIPEEADDEMGQALRDRHLQVVRHAGSTARLAERLGSLMS